MECLKEAAQRIMDSDRAYRIKRGFIFKVFFSAPVDTSVWGGGRSLQNCQCVMFSCYFLMLLCVEIHLTQMSVYYASKRIVL